MRNDEIEAIIHSGVFVDDTNLKQISIFSKPLIH
jgi:hypothetical protein